MPSLGSLFYTMSIRDFTDADLQKINAKLKNLGFDITLTPKILKDITQSAVPKGVKIELDPTIKSDAIAKAVEGKVMRIEVMPLVSNLRKALREATKDNPPEMEVGVQSVKLRRLIENILNRQGFMLNISTVNDNYSKAIQSKLNGTTYKVKIHADAAEITRSVQASLMQVQSRYFGLKVSRDVLYRSIDEALGQKRFNINIAVQQDQARKAVQDALLRAQVLGKDQALAYQRLQTGELRAAQAELVRLKAAQHEAASAAKAHATASVNLGGAMGSNIKIAGELGSAMTSLYSIHAAKEFLSQVVEIGGELEHQKIALNTIFGDKGKQIELFGQVKGLARQSPFGVMELTKSVKALSAYGVQYNEIYDTAKRLADISAATSIDINRLILAFGKTKSRTFLDGLEAKQFAYANIPIYDLLSKKLTELEGKFVSIKDVMGRIKKREIGFDLVKEVLWDMTDAGGKFYNMQEALAGSVKTSWKLVRDNIELMFGEIAESVVGSGLKDVGEILQKLTREWRMVGAVIGAAAATMGVAKIATIALNRTILTQTTSAAAEILTEKKRTAQRLISERATRTLNAAELELIRTRNRLTAADLMGEKGLSRLNSTQLQQLYLSRQISKAEIKRLQTAGFITAVERQQILSTSRLIASLRVLKTTIVNGLVSAFKFLFSPMSLVTAGLMGAAYAFERYREQGAKAEEIGKNIFTKASEGAKNLEKTVEEIKPAKGLSDLELTQGIEKMENAIKDYSATPIRDMNDSLVAQDGHLLTLTERYEVLKKKVDEILTSYQKIGDTSKNESYDKIIMPSIGVTNGFLRDGMLENAKDYSKEIERVEDFISKKLQTERAKVEKFINWAQKVSPEFKKAAKNLSLDAAYKELALNPDKYADVFTDQKGSYYIHYLTKSFKNGQDKLIKDVEEFAAELKQRLRVEWDVTDPTNMTAEQKNALVIMLNTMINEAEGASGRVKDEWRKLLEDIFNINFDEIDVTPMLSKAFTENIEDLVGKKLADNIRKGLKFSKDSAGFETIKQAVKDAAMMVYGGADNATKKAIDEALSDENINKTTGLVLQSMYGKYGKANTTEPTDSTDEFAKKLKQRFKDIKDAWSEFQKWSKTEGREAAATRIGESGLFSTLSVEQIPQAVEQYRALVVQLEKELREAGVKGTARESLLNDLLKQLLDIDKTVVDEQLKLALDKVSKEAERQLADWNLYDKIRKATGNQDLAMSIAFGMNADAETDYPAMVKKQFNDFAKAAKSALTFDTVTPEALAAAPTEVQNAWEDATKKLQQYAREQKDAVADILNEYQSLQDKLTKIDADRDRKIKTVRESDMSAPDKAKYIQRINVEADYQKFTQSADYLKFFSGIYSLTMQQAQEIGDKIRLNLDQRLQAGAISAEDYYKEIERINQQLTKLRNVKSDAMTFATSGVKGVQQKKLDKADSDILDQMTKVKKAEEDLAKVKAEGEAFDIIVAEQNLKLAKESLKTYEAVRDAIVKDQEAWQNVLDVTNIASNIAKGMSDAFNTLRDMADSFGFDTDSNAWNTAGAVIDTLTAVTGGAQKVIQSAMSGDIGGIIGGTFETLLTPFTIWSQLHDKKLQKMIERSKEAAQIMQNQYDILEKRMANFLGNTAAMNTGVTGGAYGKQRELMQGQLTELEKQRQAEIDKKKTDNSVVEDYNKQIEEMKISIRDFALEAAKDLYSIDLNGWAEQLGDSLVDAFAAGEDAAEAFDKTVGDIMRDITSKMISQDILAPMFGDLRNYLFGENGMGGAFGADFKLDASEVAAMKEYLDKIKNQGIPAAEELFNAINDATGGMLDNTDKAKSGLSAGIQSITEDTADLLASYVNAIRASVALNEGRWERLLGESLPQISVIAQSQLDAQRQIAENTLRNAVAAEAIMKSSDEINRRLARVTQGGEKLHIQ